MSIDLKLTSSDFEQPNESTELEVYQEYCLRELPRVVRASIEEIVYRETQRLEDRLINELDDIIRTAHQQGLCYLQVCI